MSKSGQNPPTPESGKSGELNLPTFPGFNPADLERLFEANRAMMQNVLEINRGLFEFVDARFKADVETFGELCKCKDWQEASKVQTRFMSNLTQQYVDQTAKLMEAAAKLLSAQRAVGRD